MRQTRFALRVRHSGWSAIQVHIFFDRLEILNPGSLVSGLKIEDLGHVSRPRNPLLFGLTDRMELVENVGSGIMRIRNAMKKYGLQPPVIRTAETWFSITFRRKKSDGAIESLSWMSRWSHPNIRTRRAESNKHVFDAAAFI